MSDSKPDPALAAPCPIWLCGAPANIPCETDGGVHEMRRQRYAIVIDAIAHNMAVDPPAPVANMPGSTAEQLPAEVLALIDVPPYVSTACEAAQACEKADEIHDPEGPWLISHAAQLHERCRLNNKFTGALCSCGCHEPKPTVPAPAVSVDGGGEDGGRRERIAAALRNADDHSCQTNDGADYDALTDAVLAVRDDEMQRLRERHNDSLRRADEINNSLMKEVQRYADGKERPVLWSVYNRMHGRALNAEATIKRARKALDQLDLNGEDGYVNAVARIRAALDRQEGS